MKICKGLINIVLLIVIEIEAEDYELDETESVASASLDSDSKEIYNYSSKEKPPKRYQLNCNDISTKTPVVKDDVKRRSNKKSPKAKLDVNKKSLSSLSYTASIQQRNSHYASGALVHKDWILSVAGLFFYVRESIKLYKVRIGTVNCKKGGQSFPLKGIEIHPMYRNGEPKFDISLLRLGKSAQFTKILQPIKLSHADGKIFSANFVVTYWPKLIVQGGVLPPSADERLKHKSMRISTQSLIPSETCRKQLQKKHVTLGNSTFCLEPITSHHGPCRPDPGAPVVADGELWGITSGWTSNDCLIHPSPTMFTRVSSVDVKSWINSLLFNI